MKYLILGSSEEARLIFGPICRDRGLEPVFVGLGPGADVQLDLYAHVRGGGLDGRFWRRPYGYVGGILGFVDEAALSLAPWLQLPGGSPWTFSDKWCREANRHGLVPEGIHTFPAEGFGVCRPRQGCGSRGVTCRVRLDDAGAREAAEATANAAGVKAAYWTRWHSGPQLSVEAVRMAGVVDIVAIADRYYEVPDGEEPYRPVELGGNTPSALDWETLQDVADVCRAYIESAFSTLGRGTIKLDVIVTPEHGPLVIESHLRLGGGWFAARQIPYVYGVNLPEVAVDFSLGRHVDRERILPKPSRPPRAIAWRLNADGTRSWGFGLTPQEAVAEAEEHWRRP